MRWQRGARIAVAAVGLIGAGAIVYFGRVGRPATSPSKVAAVDPTATLEGGAGTFTYGESGTSRVKIVFETSRRYDDGRMHFENARVEGLDKQRFTVRADVLETMGSGGDRPSAFDLSGGVVLETDDGLRLETGRAQYTDTTGVVDMPGPVMFSRGRMSGTSVGATYNRNDATIQLLKEARTVIAPDADGQGKAEGTAARMTLVRGQKSLRLEQDAQILSDTERMTADVATLYFTEDERALKYLELRGQAAVIPEATADRAPAMRADNITLAFQPDGRTLQHSTLTGRAVLTMREDGLSRSIRGSWVDVYTGRDGRILTRLDARDQVVVDLPASGTAPGRTITATTLSATGADPKGLTAARFDGRPRFEERSGTQGAPTLRTGTAEVLILALDGGLDAITKAEFRQSAKFQDGDLAAEGDVAVYDEVNGVLNLRPGTGTAARRSRVMAPDFAVDGQTIDLFLDSHNLTAKGSVATRSSGKPAEGDARPSRSGLLTDDEPVYGSADVLEYARGSGTAVYTGSTKAPARLRQDQTEIAATKIRVVDATGNLEATGRVDSVLIFAPSTAAEGTPAAPQRYRIVAEALVYEDAKRTATYRGQPAMMTSGDGLTEGQVLTLILGEATRTLERMTVETNVYAKMSGGYEADGDTLVYRAGTDVYVITGRPARVKSPNSSGEGCLLTKNLTLELNRQTGSVRSPSHGQTPGSTDAIACDVSIRSIR